MSRVETPVSATSPRAPKYFSARKALPRLAIEVPDCTKRPTTIKRKALQLSALSPKSRSQSRTPMALTPQSAKASNFSFSGRQKSLGSPRAGAALRMPANSSVVHTKPRLPQTPRTTSFRSRPMAHSSTPKARQQPLTDFITQVESRTAPPEEDALQCHLLQIFQSLRIIQQLPAVSAEELTERLVRLPRRPGFEDKKTIIFDLDETLVHCCDEDSAGMHPDVQLPITFPSGETVLVTSNQAGINVRPYVRECLQAASQDFEVIVFTASHKCYADVVLDFLDPDNTLIHHRLFRENCLVVQGLFVKDLRILVDRDIRKVAIVDNAAYSFGYQLDNGIPIISWSCDKNDRELLNLIDYLKLLSVADDVRSVNRSSFHLSDFYDECLRELQNAVKPKLRRHRRQY